MAVSYLSFKVIGFLLPDTRSYCISPHREADERGSVVHRLSFFLNLITVQETHISLNLPPESCFVLEILLVFEVSRLASMHRYQARKHLLPDLNELQMCICT